jgi:glycosyltransferase involved in cell wall biosynthesis
VNILWVSDKEGVRGGGSTSERVLLRYLEGTDHDVDHIVATSLKGSALARGPHETKQKILGKLLKMYVNSRIKRFGVPDVIVSHGIYYPQIGELANDALVPHLVFIRDEFFSCPGAKHRPCMASCWACLPKGQKVLYPLVRNLIRQKMNGLSRCDMILTNSNFMRKQLQDCTDKTVNVLYPPIETQNGNDRDVGSHDKAVYMGCGFYKGTELVMIIAKALPDLEFLLAGDPEVPRKWDLKKYPNVDWVPWIDRDIAFSSARLILFPSKWPEPFGRVPVEAGNRGIPTIGSTMGGIPESVGDGGVLVDPYDTDMWVSWTKFLMGNDDIRNWMGSMARDHSMRFGIDRIGPEFEGFLKEIVST